MPQRVSAVSAIILGGMVLGGPMATMRAQAPGEISEVAVPGGLKSAAAALNTRGGASRSHFLGDVIRRSFEAPVAVKGLRREHALQPLLAHLDRSAAAASTTRPETIPLPLTTDIWINVVFAGRARTETLLGDILRTPGASLLYCALLALDDPTRAWIAQQPDLLVQLAAEQAAAFVVAAPAFRIADGIAVLPGGEAAAPVWEALAGRSPSAPREFLKALLIRDNGRLAYFAGAVAELTSAQLRFALNLDAPDPAARAASARRLFAIFEKVASSWVLAERPFWRPTRDPALLLSDLPSTLDGRPLLPGTQEFWNEVFADTESSWVKSAADDGPPQIAGGQPVDFIWLCEQIFMGGQVQQRGPYQQVLFASRLTPRITSANARDAIVAIRAFEKYPALAAALERARLDDVAAHASAARRAARLSATARSHSAMAQFQGALAFVTRAAVRGGLPPEALSRSVSALAAIETNDRGEYEGRLLRWLAGWIDAQAWDSGDTGQEAAAPSHNRDVSVGDSALDRKALRLLAGPLWPQRSTVEWEGTRYRLDFTSAELTRLTALLGEGRRPFLTAAHTFVAAADALTSPTFRQQTTIIEDAVRAVRGDGDDIWSDDVPRVTNEVVAALQRASRASDARMAARIAPRLRLLADMLTARALTELAYAVALGHPDSAPISAADAASRHDFGFDSPGADRESPWRHGIAGADRTHDWRVTGSLLGLDVRVAQFSRVRLSAKPPAHRPVLNDEDRRVLTEAVPLAEPLLLTNEHRDRIVNALTAARARVGIVRTRAEAAAVADRLAFSPMRRTLFVWTVERDRAHAVRFLSLTELLWLGLDDAPPPSWLHAWGAPAEARNGCLCLQFTDRRSSEMFVSRWYSGILASGFADLNLRLAELLAELKMPAPLLASVLAPATWDFIADVSPQHLDDRRSLVEFVQALHIDRIEQYLALLTTDGPLVPLTDGSDPRTPEGWQ